MSPDPRDNECRSLSQAFTFVEVLVAIAIAAGVITAGVMSYQAITQSNNRLASYGEVQIDADKVPVLYPDNTSPLYSYYAPNYGRVAAAEVLRDTFYEDIGYASAVFCLSRDGLTDATQRPATIPIAATFDQRRLATAEDFRTFLETAVPATSGVFSAYRGAATDKNLSIFILVPSNSPTTLAVRAIYEVDFIDTKDDATVRGVYATVRRYAGGSGTAGDPADCTNYYDIFYPETTGTVDFAPTVVQFERASRLAVAEDDYDAFKVAANRPFYFLWWPDPAMPSLKTFSYDTLPSTDPRSAYAAMKGRTSFFMVVPMFPAL